jgi:hypothetical protein
MEDQAKKIRPKRTMEMAREQRRLAVEKYIGGRDIVSWCLEEPQHFQDNPPLQNALLGRHAFIFDTSAMIKRLTKGKVRYHEALSGRAEHPDTGCFHIDFVAWKLAYCDGATVKDEEDLERLYQERLRDEELQPPIERARELARRESEKAARRNAKWMIPAIERLDSEVIEEARDSILSNDRTLCDLWRQVSPPPPQWIQTILENDQPWGFVIYKTAEVEKKYGHKWFSTEENDWQGTWGYTEEEDRIGHGPLDKRDRQYTTNSSIHYGGRLDRVGELERLIWPQTDDEGARVIENADGFREYVVYPAPLHQEAIGNRGTRLTFRQALQTIQGNTHITWRPPQHLHHH